MIVSVLTDIAVGGTFLSWSLHFLNGDIEYYDHELQEFKELTKNPLTQFNAHGFRANQICFTGQSHDIFDDAIKKFQSYPTHLHVMYMHQLTDRIKSSISVNGTKFAISKLQNVADKSIILFMNPKNSLYNWSFYVREASYKFNDVSIRNTSNQEQLEDFITYFFNDSLNNWNTDFIKMPVWEQREFIALNIRPYEFPDNLLSLIDDNITGIKIDTFDFYENGINTIESIFNYLGLQINSIRFKQWIPIYLEWQKLQLPRASFAKNLSQIIDDILVGKSTDLSLYLPDLVRESVILHELLYKYNLNIKGYGVKTFTNTKQIHDLLETNTIHCLDNIYGVANK